MLKEYFINVIKRVGGAETVLEVEYPFAGAPVPSVTGLMSFGVTINADTTINLANYQTFQGLTTPVAGNRTLTFSEDLPEGFYATFEGQATIAGDGLAVQNADEHTAIKANGVATVYVRDGNLILVGQTE